MDDLPTIPSAQSIPTYVEDGARIAAILLVWGVIAAFFTYGIGNVGLRGQSIVGGSGRYLGMIFAFAGALNALLYVVCRGVDYWHAYQ
ncbi:MAG: hypothetical protein ABEJ55_06420 [Halanaeroarchaeum sp.]